MNRIHTIDAEKAIANRGNWFRLKKVMTRALGREPLTIGFIGGSITQGALSTAFDTCYAYRVYRWWQKKFPMAGFTYRNAGIGGTTSQFGAARVWDDLLVHEPDVVFVEFSVNDENTEHFFETYEGLIRKIYYSEKEPAVILIHNVFYQDGQNAEEVHNKVGCTYGLPCISMKESIYPEIKAGRIRNRELTPDDLHPNDLGHELVSDMVTYFLEKAYADLNREEKPVQGTVNPLTKNRYQNSVRYQNACTNYSSKGFTADTSKQESITQCFKNGWVADKKGASILFTIEGTGFSVQYRKSVKKPSPVAMAIVDGDEENAVILDGNFLEDWGDCLYLQTLTEGMESGLHQMEIRIVKTQETDVVPFYLVSIIGTI